MCNVMESLLERGLRHIGQRLGGGYEVSAPHVLYFHSALIKSNNILFSNLAVACKSKTDALGMPG